MTDTIRVRFTEGGGGCLSEVSIIGDPGLPTLKLTDLFTHPKLRRKGLARKVVGYALGWADECGYALTLEVVPHRTGGAPRAALKAFYASVGFVPAGRSTMTRPCSKNK